MYMIDNVYKQSYESSDDFLTQLKTLLSNNPIKFENEFRNLKSFVVELE